jgi:hypothetical protein
VGRVHLLKELAERAKIQLNTHTMDGKLDPLTRLHHVIQIAKYSTGRAENALLVRAGTVGNVLTLNGCRYDLV